ncbi:MAG: sugar transferase [Verrucomicrobiota bacterium]
MLHRDQEIVVQVLQVLDALLLCLALYLAHTFRLDILPILKGIEVTTDPGIASYYWAIVLLIPLGPLVLERQDIYRLHVEQGFLQRVWRIFKAVFILLVLLTIFMVTLRIPQDTIYRMAFVIFVPLATSLIALREYFFQLWLKGRGNRLVARQQVLLCGIGGEREKWKQEMNKVPGGAYKIMEEVDLSQISHQDFIDKLHNHSVDIVIFMVDHTNLPEIRDSLIACESEGIEAWVSADFFGTSLARPSFDEFLQRPLLVFRSTPDASFELVIKRMIDIVGSLTLIVLLSPLFLALFLIIRFQDGSPVFFRQKRSGLFGRPFTMIKYRSMVMNAEQVRAKLQEQNQMSGPVFKVEDDPRVTRLGKWMRRTSIDELPQLWNVLRGQMSLVGPRPLPLYETENFESFAHRRRMSVKPGLTCLWQISGRNKIKDFRDWVELDLEYIDNWSLWLDIKILLKTIPVVLFGKGAS